MNSAPLPRLAVAPFPRRTRRRLFHAGYDTSLIPPPTNLVRFALVLENVKFESAYGRNAA